MDIKSRYEITAKQITLVQGYFAGHDDVIKWKHFRRYWQLVQGIHWPPVNSPHKVQWRGALMFSLIWVWTNGWINNREAGDLRRTSYLCEEISYINTRSSSHFGCFLMYGRVPVWYSSHDHQGPSISILTWFDWDQGIDKYLYPLFIWGVISQTCLISTAVWLNRHWS